MSSTWVIVTPAIRAGSLLPEVMSGVGKHPPPKVGRRDKSRLSLITENEGHPASGWWLGTPHPPSPYGVTERMTDPE